MAKGLSAAQKDLRQAAAAIGRLNDEFIKLSATHAVESAIEIGGTWGGVMHAGTGTQLRARVVATKNNKKEVSATVWPTPAWSWSVASYGRDATYPATKKALRIRAKAGGVYFAKSAGAVPTGDKRVVRWHEQCDGRVVPLADQLTEDALNGK